MKTSFVLAVALLACAGVTRAVSDEAYPILFELERASLAFRAFGTPLWVCIDKILVHLWDGMRARGLRELSLLGGN